MMSHHLHKPYTVTRRRTHLKPSQVAVLQESFVINQLPDAGMRGQLAQELGVTERTVQIWFQNRRAKARKLEAAGGTPSLVPNVRTGWIDVPNISQQQSKATFRSYMTPDSYENEPTIKRRPRSCSKPEKNTNSFAVPMPPQRAMSEGMGRIDSNETKASKQYLVSFPVNTIRIGSWARFASQVNNEWDLVCYSDPTLRQLIWQVGDDGHQFRIEVQFNAIQQVRLGSQVATDLGQLEIDVKQSMLSFSMRRQGIDEDWVRCGDFTENQQATSTTEGEVGTHILQGSHDSLKQSLLELLSQAPHLASKLVILPDQSDYLCRDLTISPSATPEPIAAAAAAAHYTSLMFMEKSASSNMNSNHNTATTTTATSTNPWNNSYYYPSYDQNTSWTYLNMLHHQQQQSTNNNNVLNSFI